MFSQDIPVFMDLDTSSVEEIEAIIDYQDREFEKDFRSMASGLLKESLESPEASSLFHDLLQARREHFYQRQQQTAVVVN